MPPKPPSEPPGRTPASKRKVNLTVKAAETEATEPEAAEPEAAETDGEFVPEATPKRNADMALPRTPSKRPRAKAKAGAKKASQSRSMYDFPHQCDEQNLQEVIDLEAQSSTMEETNPVRSNLPAGLGHRSTDYSFRLNRAKTYKNEDSSDDEFASAPATGKRPASPIQESRSSKRSKGQPAIALDSLTGDALRSIASYVDSRESRALDEIVSLSRQLDRKDEDIRKINIELDEAKVDRGEGEKIAKELKAQIKKLEKERQKSEKASKKLVDRVQRLEHENSVLRERIGETNDLKQRHTELQKEHRAASKELKCSAKSIANLEQSLSNTELESAEHREALCKSQEEVDLLLKNLVSEKDRAGKLQGIFDKLKQNYLQLRQEQEKDADYFNDKTSDDWITTEWGILVNLIHQLVVQVLIRDPNDRKLPTPPAHSPEIESLLAACTSSPGFVAFHIERFIWNRIHQDIFLEGERPWGGQVGLKFFEFVQSIHGELEEKIGLLRASQSPEPCSEAEGVYKDAEELSFVKGRASQLLNPIFERWEKEGNRLEKITASLTRDLAIFIDPSRRDRFETSTGRILEKDLKLHQVFMMSRAYIIPRMPDENSQPFNREEMDRRFSLANPEEEQCNVSVIISPMVVKIGNADGYNFRARHVLCKAMVILKPAARPIESSCETVDGASSTIADSVSDDESKQLEAETTEA